MVALEVGPRVIADRDPGDEQREAEQLVLRLGCFTCEVAVAALGRPCPQHDGEHLQLELNAALMREHPVLEHVRRNGKARR